jgi:copper chaperone NosL
VKSEKRKMKNEKWNMKFIMLLVITSLASVSCSVSPDPIHYGEDDCVHCTMTIMDRRYGTEIVTNKGKVFKFDSVECMVEYLLGDKVAEGDVKLVLVTPFNRPEELVDAGNSQVLHCKDLPSPMGKYLTAFKDKTDAMHFREEYGGVLFSWEDLLNEYRYLP